MRIFIGGDVVATENNVHEFQTGNMSDLFDPSFFSFMQGCDIRIFNLEMPITNTNERIDKSGPHLVASPEIIAGIKALNPSLVTIANNHILDCGEPGLLDTINLLSKSNIPYVGAGMTAEEAAQPYILKHEGVKIGVYGCCEHEFSIAENGHAGANPIDLLESFDHVSSLKEKCDYVIVLYHGGRECYRYPTILQQKICRKFASKGADAVICQHSHCVGSFETYNGSTILYGQGNLLFDKYHNEFWNSAIAVEIELNGDGKASVGFIPVIRNSGPFVCTAKEGQSVLTQFYSRSEQIKDQKALAEMQAQEAEKSALFYYFVVNGSSPLKRKLVRILERIGKYKPFYSKKNNLALLNVIRCETHREMMSDYLIHHN